MNKTPFDEPKNNQDGMLPEYQFDYRKAKPNRFATSSKKSVNTGSDFEEYVRQIYSILLNMKDEGILVTRNATLRGNNGHKCKIDVYYEFWRAGIRHRVIIECKDWGSPVDQDKIHALESKVRHNPGVIGVIISRSGYQSGAKDFAEQQGILALTLDNLPTLNTLIAERLTTVALPDETTIGEPFWTIMEVRNGKNTGSYFLIQPHSLARKPFIPLFFSKYHAELFLKQAEQLTNLDTSMWAVRGLPHYSLRQFVIRLESFEIRRELFGMESSAALLMFLPPDAKQADHFAMIPITREQLATEYYGEQVPSIKDQINWWHHL